MVLRGRPGAIWLSRSAISGVIERLRRMDLLDMVSPAIMTASSIMAGGVHERLKCFRIGLAIIRFLGVKLRLNEVACLISQLVAKTVYHPLNQEICHHPVCSQALYPLVFPNSHH